MADAKQRQYLIIGGVAVGGYLLYRFYTGSQASAAAATGGPPNNATASDYASLAAQEQADVAALQSQNQQLSALEKSDAQALPDYIARQRAAAAARRAAQQAAAAAYIAGTEATHAEHNH